MYQPRCIIIRIILWSIIQWKGQTGSGSHDQLLNSVKIIYMSPTVLYILVRSQKPSVYVVTYAWLSPCLYLAIAQVSVVVIAQCTHANHPRLTHKQIKLIHTCIMQRSQA
jgi:hypothetical protein